jgi:hypothetical protein
VSAGSLDPLFRWLESTAFSVWIVESPSLFAFPGILAVQPSAWLCWPG